MSLVEVELDQHVATVRLNRPQAMNAISGETADRLHEAFEKVAADKDAWVVILAAAGEKAFCVGADLKERAGFSLEDFHANRVQVKGMFEALRAVPQPVIASCFGFALGGGFELALSCDLIVASEGTMFGLPEARVGLLPAGGGTQLLARKLGTSRAKELIFTGKRIDAAYAQQVGLVAEIAPPGQLGAVTQRFAEEIARSSPVAVRAAKRSIDRALGVPIADGIEIENDAWKEVIASEDRLEGITAFNEKRDARWQNR